jgi:hypothetical protein
MKRRMIGPDGCTIYQRRPLSSYVLELMQPVPKSVPVVAGGIVVESLLGIMEQLATKVVSGSATNKDRKVALL